MEIEIRYYFSKNSKDKILNKLNTFNELNYQGTFYEKTDQYNHPMKEYNFYSKEIDGRFRVRKTSSSEVSKCMITWKRRLPSTTKELIHTEEEVEVSIDPSEYDNLIHLLQNVIHLDLVESYEKYRSVYSNKEIEIVVDEYPFGIALEIEDKTHTDKAKEIINYWLEKLNLNINDAYQLSLGLINIVKYVKNKEKKFIISLLLIKTCLVLTLNFKGKHFPFFLLKTKTYGIRNLSP